MPQIPFKYLPVVCPQCGEIGPSDRKWTCGCGKYTHYPEDTKATARWRKQIDMMHIHIKQSHSSRKSKRYGSKKVSSGFENRYRIET